MSAISSPGATGAWSYRTGPWFAAFGPRVTVLLPESQRDQVIGVWSLVDGGAGFDEVLDALLASGLSRLPGFVLVSTDDGPTRVLLRGTGVGAVLTAPAEPGGVVELDGSAGSTWVERSVEGVESLSVVLTDVEPGTDHAETDFPHPHRAGAGVADRPTGGGRRTRAAPRPGRRRAGGERGAAAGRGAVPAGGADAGRPGARLRRAGRGARPRRAGPRGRRRAAHRGADAARRRPADRPDAG
ncbi:hypothetical protein [Nocardioides sp. TF02-7]|uniref:hypothetical protein n=1 Tax=Nocardioides sp. TF02-7 TaxID=2917724 RepID=UPI001F0678C1|nr:hypothetical protein [Nocardioides sp. TF02-7]UMG94975.1 hypothetical protein MF408_14525 [Nocardioides sp. TF02-7]